MGHRSRTALRLLLIFLFLALIIIGREDYRVLRLLVRVLCPPCVG